MSFSSSENSVDFGLISTSCQLFENEQKDNILTVAGAANKSFCLAKDVVFPLYHVVIKERLRRRFL